MDLFINGEKVSEEIVKKYGLKAGATSPFSSSVVTTSAKQKGEITIEAPRKTIKA